MSLDFPFVRLFEFGNVVITLIYLKATFVHFLLAIVLSVHRFADSVKHI